MVHKFGKLPDAKNFNWPITNAAWISNAGARERDEPVITVYTKSLKQITSHFNLKWPHQIQIQIHFCAPSANRRTLIHMLSWTGRSAFSSGRISFHCGGPSKIFDELTFYECLWGNSLKCQHKPDQASSMLRTAQTTKYFESNVNTRAILILFSMHHMWPGESMKFH